VTYAFYSTFDDLLCTELYLMLANYSSVNIILVSIYFYLCASVYRRSITRMCVSVCQPVRKITNAVMDVDHIMQPCD